ncbi:MAG: thiamine pyrophosphate-dependent dehydrogenase E1 component subunit alpha [Lentisphaeria bacterium]|nr:thiamine pyrophosphate-dependent dehydrogenase E1 component subunit alpha [Lentisphaeria bacterium]
MKNELENYRMMVLIRRFEETIERLFSQGDVKGTTHPSTGQEAVPVGVCAALGPGDMITSNHRGHGHFLARGGDPGRMMAEFFGKATGYSGGRGGSQLMADYGIGFLGGNGITGGNIPTAVGAAFSAKYLKRDRVAVCFFGDGAANQGTCHEAMNLAAVWCLPVVFVCENNQYAMSTPVAAAAGVPDLAVRAAGYGFPGEVVDGNDVEAVTAAVGLARERALSGRGPTLLECKTYRLSGHSRGDPRRYRSRGEEAAARKVCPIVRYKAVLTARGLLDEPADADLVRDVEEQVAQAVAFAKNSPYPDVADLERGVFA